MGGGVPMAGPGGPRCMPWHVPPTSEAGQCVYRRRVGVPGWQTKAYGDVAQTREIALSRWASRARASLLPRVGVGAWRCLISGNNGAMTSMLVYIQTCKGHFLGCVPK